VTSPSRPYEVSHADKALGVYNAMDGNKEREMEHLTAPSEHFGPQLRAAKRGKNAALHALHFSPRKTFEYPMVVTRIYEETRSSILKPTLSPALYKAGMSMKFPRNVLFGPDLFQGFQLQHPFVGVTV